MAPRPASSVDRAMLTIQATLSRLEQRFNNADMRDDSFRSNVLREFDELRIATGELRDRIQKLEREGYAAVSSAKDGVMSAVKTASQPRPWWTMVFAGAAAVFAASDKIPGFLRMAAGILKSLMENR